MPHIELSNEFPGVIALLFHKPAVGRPLHALAQVALRGPSSLTAGERELIAAHVSKLNECEFCQQCHSNTATVLLQDGGAMASCVLNGAVDDPRLSPKMRALLHLASRVQMSGRAVSTEDIEDARTAGASDDEIHDTVLVASFFCFVNRYVDGLGTDSPTAPSFFLEAGEYVAKRGYEKPNPIGRFFIRRMVRRHVGAGAPA